MLIKSDTTGPSGLGFLEIRHPMDLDPKDLPPIVGNAHVFEADTYTCTHCNAVVVMNPDRSRPRYKCRGCNHHICDSCAALRTAGAPCKTMQQQADEYFEQVERQGQAGEATSIILP